MWPSLWIDCASRSYCIWLERSSRSPWRASTLPLRVARPSTPTVAWSLSMFTTSSSAPLRGAGAPRPGAAAEGAGDWGQGGSAACATAQRRPAAARRQSNGPGRSMKSGIIMARHSNAGRKTSPDHMLEPDARRALIADWLTGALRLEVRSLESASSDASFRRYFRATTQQGTFIVMDAPPPREDVRPYLTVSA